MSENRFKGLTKGDLRALNALGVELLEGDQVTAAYRITEPQWVHAILQAQKGESKARAIGARLVQDLSDDS